MGSICSSICCQKQKFKKNDKKSQKKNALMTLNEITPDIQYPDPLEVPTIEMTKYYTIPEDFSDESEVLKMKGYKKGVYMDSGSFATVYKAVHISTGFVVAIKEIQIPFVTKLRKRLDVLKDVKNELHILQKIRHPHVIKLIDHFIIEWKVKKKSKLFMFIQFAQGGSLSALCDKYGPFDEKICKLWTAQIMSGLIYMQSKGIAHRDLKLSNILLDESKDVLISDFGLSRVVWRQDEDKELTSTTFCGTPPYMAPELLKLKATKDGEKLVKEYFAFKVDVWALGVVIYKLFTKDFPFPSRIRKSLRYMEKKKYTFPQELEVKPSHEMKNFLNKLFEPEPNDRPELKAMINEPWIREIYRNVEQTTSQRMFQMKLSFDLK